MQGHLDGGRACLLATRVSRSVWLSVCEAVIRFQDFPSVTGLLTKLNTPLHGDNHHHLTTPNPWAATPQQTGATFTCNHTQITLSQTQNLNLPHILLFFCLCCKCKIRSKSEFFTLQWYTIHSPALSLFLSGSLLFLYLCLLSPPSPLPLPWMAGQAVSCAGSEEVRTPRCTLIMKGLSHPPPFQTHTHTLIRTHSPHRHGDGTSPALSPGGKLGI